MSSNFRVGDVVCTHRDGTGEVVSIDYKADEIWVRFVKDSNGSPFEAHDFFTLEGKDCSTDNHPILRQGTWGEVFSNLPEIKPKRTKMVYLNVWLDDLDVSYCYLYDSATDALSARDKYMFASKCKFIKVAEEVEVEE